MRKNDSEKAARGRAGQGGSERLWNLAAVLGLLLIGVILGGFIGVLLDRQGLFGGDATRQTVRILPLPAPEPAPQATRAPQPVLPRIAESPEAGTDREALEARYHAGLRDTAEEDLPLVAVPPPAASNAPLWLRNAVAAALGDGRPMIAIVLDDVGVNRRGARQAIALPGPLTLSFMTYANDLAAMTAEARAAGHELMLHVPMQPQNETIDPGPNVLRADLPPEELRQRLTWGLARYDGYVGINNHMGSRFTTSEEGMALVMAELKAPGQGRRALCGARHFPGQCAGRPGRDRAPTGAAGADRPRRGLCGRHRPSARRDRGGAAPVDSGDAGARIHPGADLRHRAPSPAPRQRSAERRGRVEGFRGKPLLRQPLRRSCFPAAPSHRAAAAGTS
jgi:hypothetical protein